MFSSTNKDEVCILNIYSNLIVTLGFLVSTHDNTVTSLAIHHSNIGVQLKKSRHVIRPHAPTPSLN